MRRILSDLRDAHLYLGAEKDNFEKFKAEALFYCSDNSFIRRLNEFLEIHLSSLSKTEQIIHHALHYAEANPMFDKEEVAVGCFTKKLGVSYKCVEDSGGESGCMVCKMDSNVDCKEFLCGVAYRSDKLNTHFEYAD